MCVRVTGSMMNSCKLFVPNTYFRLLHTFLDFL